MSKRIRRIKGVSTAEDFLTLLAIGLGLANDLYKYKSNMVDTYTIYYRIVGRVYVAGDYDTVSVISTTPLAALDKAAIGFTEACIDASLYDIHTGGVSVAKQAGLPGIVSEAMR